MDCGNRQGYGGNGAMAEFKNGMVASARQALYPPHRMNRLLLLALMGLIHLYRWTLSPFLALVCGPGAGCRYTPTCSAYALEALRMHGIWPGGWLALRRLLRCHPWGAWGYDPVPQTANRRFLRDSQLSGDQQALPRLQEGLSKAGGGCG